MDREEALERAQEWFSAGRAKPAQVDVEEFDLCFVAGEIPELPADMSRPPSTIGGTFLIIDRETGEQVSWPLMDPELAAAEYVERKRGQ